MRFPSLFSAPPSFFTSNNNIHFASKHLLSSLYFHIIPKIPFLGTLFQSTSRFFFFSFFLSFEVRLEKPSSVFPNVRKKHLHPFSPAVEMGHKIENVTGRRKMHQHQFSESHTTCLLWYNNFQCAFHPSRPRLVMNLHRTLNWWQVSYTDFQSGLFNKFLLQTSVK